MSNVGRIIHGLCNGFFGRDSYEDKRIEAEGFDWVVAREIDSGTPVFCAFTNHCAGDKQAYIDTWATKSEIDGWTVDAECA